MLGVQFLRGFSTSAAFSHGKKVAVLGASGGIGQPLSLLLKQQSDLISHLSLYDIANTPGVAADLSHINTNVKVTGHKGPEALPDALNGCDVVVIPAGVPRKPGMTRDDLFNTNASIVQTLAAACARHCPKAHFLIISNPVNSTVPIFAQVLKRNQVYNPAHLFGVTILDAVRASTFVAETKGKDPKHVRVNVVGGHSGPTIVPLLSQLALGLTQSEIEKITHRIQYGGDEVVKAKDGAGSATLSMAAAGARFTHSLLQALNGASGCIEPAFVQSPLMQDKGIEFFASNVTLGRDGVQEIHPLGKFSEYEASLLEKCIPELKQNIEKGLAFSRK